jgi:hypothetical protein
METEFDRLVIVAKLHFKSLANLSELLGFNKQNFYTYKKRGTLGRKTIDRLENFGINPRYIRCK